MYVFGCTLMSKPSVHSGGTELFDIEKESFTVTRLSYMIKRIKAISEGSRENVKAPSHRLSCESSVTLQLFKESSALLQTIDCRKVWGKQPTGTEQGSAHCLV
jgi:hypothetical protein